MSIINLVDRSLRSIVSNRLNYLVVTSVGLLVIHFPYAITTLLAWDLPPLVWQSLHLLFSTAWLLGFIPARVANKLVERINISLYRFKPYWQKLMANYAMTH